MNCRNMSLYLIVLLIGWQYRWFVLDDNAGLFSYYTSKEKMMRGVRRGCVRLRGAIIGIDDEVDIHLHYVLCPFSPIIENLQ